MTTFTKHEIRMYKNRTAIMRHAKWADVSGVMAAGKLDITAAVSTACTDGWNTKYSPAFMDTLDEAQLRFLILHEEWGHKAHQHMRTWRTLWKEDARLANIAMDTQINTSLVHIDNGEGFIKMPDVGIKPNNKYLNWSVGAIYADLKKNPPEEPQDPTEPGDEGGEGGDPRDGAGLDEHDWEGAEAEAGKDEERGKEIDRMLRQGESIKRKMGKGAGGAQGTFGDLLKAKIDWKQVLREFVTAACRGRDETTWRKLNRRFIASGVYMPGTEGVQVGELVIMMDVSGSCFSSAEQTAFVSELQGMVEEVHPEKLHVLYVDYSLQGHQVFEDGQFAVHSMVVRGGGGTDLRVGFDYVAEKKIAPACMIVFTDAETPWPATAPAYPVLCVSVTEGRMPFGTTVKLEV